MRKIIEFPVEIKSDLDKIAIGDGKSLKTWIEGLIFIELKKWRDAKRN